MFLADTNVISELARARPDPALLAWAEKQPLFAVSVITVEELEYGFGSRPNPELQARLDVFLSQNCEVVPIDEAVARRGGELRGTFARRGITRTQADLLIAATVQVHRYTLATRNVRDFAGCGIRVMNPFGCRHRPGWAPLSPESPGTRAPLALPSKLAA